MAEDEGPLDWLRQAQQMGMVRNAQNGGRPAGTATVDEDPEDEEMNRILAAARKRKKAEELQDLIDEEEDRKEERGLKRQLRLNRLRQSVEGGGTDTEPRGSDPQLADALATWREDRAQLMGRLTELQTSLTKSGEDNLKQEIAGLRQLIMTQNPTATATNPFDELTRAFDMAKTVRDRVDSLMPAAPTVAPVDPQLTREQIMGRERMELEHELRMAQFKLEMARTEKEREERQTEYDAKAERLQGFLNMGEGVLGKLMESVGPSLAGLVGGIGGGGASAPGMGAGLAPAGVPQAQPVGAPVAPSMLPYPCPKCGQQNLVPPGTTATQCGQCGYGPIILVPKGSPPPPGARRSA